MRAAGPGHFAQTEIQALCQNDVQQSEPVFARYPSAQMGEGICEPGVIVHIHEEIRTSGRR